MSEIKEWLDKMNSNKERDLFDRGQINGALKMLEMVKKKIEKLNTEEEIEDFWFSIGVGRTRKNSINLGDVKETIGLFSKVLLKALDVGDKNAN